jgi:hypothetical protein
MARQAVPPVRGYILILLAISGKWGRRRRDPFGGHDLGQGPTGAAADNRQLQWKPISTAPFDRDLELAVVEDDGPHALVFPCRRILARWMDAETTKRVDVRPTHWRAWRADPVARPLTQTR